jgi:hypothetical protein
MKTLCDFETNSQIAGPASKSVLEPRNIAQYNLATVHRDCLTRLPQRSWKFGVQWPYGWAFWP